MSPDLDLESEVPPNPNDFGVLILALIGPADDNCEEAFTITVCTPTWLAARAESDSERRPTFLRHYLLVHDWDPPAFKRAVEDLARRATGQNWNEVAQKIGRYLAWEFEDYKL